MMKVDGVKVYNSKQVSVTELNPPVRGITIVVEDFGMVPKSLEKRLGELDWFGLVSLFNGIFSYSHRRTVVVLFNP